VSTGCVFSAASAYFQCKPDEVQRFWGAQRFLTLRSQRSELKIVQRRAALVNVASLLSANQNYYYYYYYYYYNTVNNGGGEPYTGCHGQPSDF